MNGPLRRVTVVVIVLFSLLFLNLNWVQFVQHDEYKTNEWNNRTTLEEYSRQRGSILAGDTVLAESVPTKEGDLKYQRQYPEGEAYAHLTGFKSLYYGTKGVELYENDILSGNAPELFTDRMREMFTGETLPGGNVKLSVDPKLQEQAYEAMKNSGADGPASAVALDPATGQILAQASSSSYDPNPLASHDNGEASAAATEYESGSQPMLDRTIGDVYPPGSTMKVIVAAAALQAGLTPDSQLPSGSSYTPPDTNQEVNNAADQCAETETLRSALAKSCNTTFARLCVDDFEGKVDDGTEAFRETAEAFGFEDDNVSTPQSVAKSSLGDIDSEAFVAQACFGQKDVQVTPMMMAMVAATVANDGTGMNPQLVKELQAPDKSSLGETSAETYAEPIDSSVASDLKSMMEEVVNGAEGTGTAAQIEGTTVGGKTGTAQNGDNPDHGWFMGYAENDDGDPAVAVAVFLPNAGDGGSTEATTIGGDLMRTVVGK